MALEAYLECPRCKDIYNIHKQLYDKGENFPMYCPKCTALLEPGWMPTRIRWKKC